MRDTLEERLAREAVNLENSDASRIEIPDEIRDQVEELVSLSEAFPNFKFGIDKSTGNPVVADHTGLNVKLESDDPEPPNDTEPSGKYVWTPDGWDK